MEVRTAAIQAGAITNFRRIRHPVNLGVNEDLSKDGVADGLLRITAAYDGDGYQYGEESEKHYTSDRIRTTKKTEALFTNTYGYVEARMSLPATKGAWPAFWMLPESTSIYGSWPISGEIDIMETCGAFANGSQSQACGTLHWGAPEHVYKGSGYVNLTSDYTYFHTYAIDWEPGKITWYYDGEPIHTMTNWESGFAGASDTLAFDAPFDQPFYMLLNLAVDSGQFGGTVNKATFQDEMNMYVDYVRVYQKTEGYADSAERSASGTIQSDWADYAGINQIADIATDNLVSNLSDGNVSGVENGSTGVDKSKWYLGYQADASDATAAIVTDDAGKNWAKVGVHTPGSQNYSVQLIGHYDAKAGYLYQVSYDAYAEGDLVGKTVNCDAKEWKGWSTYGITSFELKNAPTHYSYLVDQTEDFEDCRIEFNLGAAATGAAYIGNVKVEIIDPALIDREEENRAPLSDGNVIYNGTFDQGNKHVAYWTAGDNTSLLVPRYTTEKLADRDLSVVDVASKTNYEKIADGMKYYERRGQISAPAGVKPIIYQSGFSMPTDSYTMDLNLYSKKDTTVKAAIYSVRSQGDTSVLEQELCHTEKSYTAADGVTELHWSFDTTTDLEQAALVLEFGDGATVQVDQVTLVGASLGEKVDETPLDTETTWVSDGQSGTATSVTGENGVYTVGGITSGTTWYAPQIISNDFSLAAGKNYKLKFKYKLEGNTNHAFEYIIQENGGSWTVFGNGPTKVAYDAAAADEDGFCTYEITIPAAVSLSNVHMVFGLGNSEATGDGTFQFKDVTLSLEKETEEEKPPVVLVDAKVPVIQKQPASQNCAYKDKITIKVTVAASDEGSLSYQWYQNTKKSTTGAKAIAGAKKASYTVPTTTVGTRYYYCMVTNTNSKATGVQTAQVTSGMAKVVVIKAVNPLTKAAAKVTKSIAGKAFFLNTKAQGTTSYKVADTKVAAVSKSGKVTIKGIGKTTITVKAAGNDSYKSATVKIALVVTPKKAVLSKVKPGRAKTMTATWKRDRLATGYQIQCALDAKFTKALTSKRIKSNKTTTTTFTKLKKNKTYYVRIRSYKTVKGSNIYGSWSGVKRVKIKR